MAFGFQAGAGSNLPLARLQTAVEPGAGGDFDAADCARLDRTWTAQMWPSQGRNGEWGTFWRWDLRWVSISIQ